VNPADRGQSPGADVPDALALLAEALTPVPPDRQVRDKLLAQLQGPERFAPFARDVARHFALEHEQALVALRLIPGESLWRPGPWPGSRLLTTEGLLGAGAMIAALPPGTCIAQHRHHTRELTYVLDGELIADGTLHGAGALLDMPPGSEHTVTVSANAGCLVVFSATSRTP
jgi:putative transcriptional regulator